MSLQEDYTNVEQVVCMNGGRGGNSYANNSNYQRDVMLRARHILEQSVKDTCTTFCSSSKCLTIADVGCATGPNSWTAVTDIITIVCKTWDELAHQHASPWPSFLVFLNDLPSNDFNTLFRSLAEFYDPLRENGRESFVAAVPGSFYGRLFPSQSLHFVHSSYTLHWLSKVPDGLSGENGEALNKGNICICKSSSLTVQKAYSDQFKSDFKTFLNARSDELVHGGNMVLTFLGSAVRNEPVKIIEVISLLLGDMVKEGLIKESKLDKFNLPIHTASEEEIREVIIDEGHLTLRKVEIIKAEWDAGNEENDKSNRGEYVAKYLRAVYEPQLSVAFGEAIMDELFRRASVKYTQIMDAEDCLVYNIVVWLTRNDSSHC